MRHKLLAGIQASLIEYPPLRYNQILAIRNLRKEYFKTLKKRPSSGVFSDSGEKREILEKANGRCVICGYSEKLKIHHMDYDNSPYGNVLVLCARCHSALHSTNWIGDYPLLCPHCRKPIYLHGDLMTEGIWDEVMEGLVNA